LTCINQRVQEEGQHDKARKTLMRPAQPQSAVNPTLGLSTFIP